MAELFVQVEVSFPDSKLVAQAERLLGLNRDEAMGKLLRLWLAVMRAREGGDLSHRTDSWIEDAVGWRGEPGLFAAFVREHHTDEGGTIRDWQEKYGKLDKQRQQYREKKREQRSGARVPRRVPETVSGTTGNVPLDVPGTVPTDVPPAVPQNASNNLQSSPSLSSYQATENGRETAHARDPLDAILADSRLGEALTDPEERGLIAGFLRSQKRPAFVAGVLYSHLTDIHHPAVSTAVLALAVQEYGAMGEERFSSAHFGGFVKRAEKTLSERAGRFALKREAQHIDHEAIEREREAREIAEGDALLADFERTHEAQYEALRQEAEGTVDRRVPKMMRAAAVRAKLIALVRAATDMRGNHGAS